MSLAAHEYLASETSTLQSMQVINLSVSDPLVPMLSIPLRCVGFLGVVVFFASISQEKVVLILDRDGLKSVNKKIRINGGRSREKLKLKKSTG